MRSTVASDGAQSVLDEAWGHIPQAHDTTAGTGTFTRARVERNLSLVSGLGALVLGTQAFVTALGHSDAQPAWHVPIMALTFAPLAAMVLACFVGRGVRITSAGFAVLYLVALVLWPIATAGSEPIPLEEPWIWFLVSISTLASALAFPLAVQIAWAVVAPLLFGFVRIIQLGTPGDALGPLALDVSFALILNGVILSLGWVFRSVAANVDRTRALAVTSYASAAAADAAEEERIAVAALMHDSVLAALIAAERADTPRERTLAVAMAREALTRLANTERDALEGSDEPTDAGAIADEIERAARELGVYLRAARTIEPLPGVVPGRVARALVLAATQAIANAIEHAEARGLALDVLGLSDPTRVSIEVRDAGTGFAPDEIPDDRLGIRGSIIARVAAVGGTSRIDAGADGTIVHLEWQEPAA